MDKLIFFRCRIKAENTSISTIENQSQLETKTRSMCSKSLFKESLSMQNDSIQSKFKKAHSKKYFHFEALPQ
jgi:hypothetical protein